MVSPFPNAKCWVHTCTALVTDEYLSSVLVLVWYSPLRRQDAALKFVLSFLTEKQHSVLSYTVHLIYMNRNTQNLITINRMLK